MRPDDAALFGEPAEGYRGEHVVDAEGVLGEPVVVDLGLELLVDPGSACRLAISIDPV
jgi:hypothetical protein